jgi:mannose-6-phosphate isomerase-like protein (cupin superfamily)
MEYKLVSEDGRRKLSEFGNGGNWKVCKVVEMKETAIIGDHYHKNKDEMFLLIDGGGTFTVGDKTQTVSAPFSVFIPRHTYHSFRLYRGSVLLGLASEEHDPKAAPKPRNM